MKTIFKQISLLLLTMAALAVATACQDDNRSSLDLNGDTWITQLSVDGYSGIVNRSDKSITVEVPETYDTSSMKITDIQVSEGATASMKVGDLLNLDFPQVIRVSNGDVFLDYTLTVKRDEAKILSFKLNDTFIGVINQDTRTITVSVPEGTDVSNMVATIVTNEGASVAPASGQASNYTTPVDFVVSYHSASALYTVTVVVSGAPEAVYVGLSAEMDALNPEEKEAAVWMLNHVPGAQYVSFDDIANDRVDLSKCTVMWWHLHIDGGIDTMEKFDQAAPQAVQAMTRVKELYDNGMNLLLTRYATYYAAKIGATLDGRNPNNCWGGKETEGEITGGAWSFFIQGHESHPLYQGLTMKSGAEQEVFTCDAGYRITNSTAQWHIGADWGGYADYNAWQTAHGGVDLGYGGDGAVVVWEYPAQETKGGIVCIGSGCYDWYADGIDTSADIYHANVAAMTLNAIDYLNQQTNK